MDRLVLAPKWRPLNGVVPSCWILKSSGSNILHDKNIANDEVKKFHYNDSRDQCYKTFYGRKLRLFIISVFVLGIPSLMFVGEARRLP